MLKFDLNGDFTYELKKLNVLNEFENNFDDLNNDFCYSETGVGYFCTICDRLFANYLTYDEHFEQSDKCMNCPLPNPIEIEVCLI